MTDSAPAPLGLKSRYTAEWITFGTSHCLRSLNFSASINPKFISRVHLHTYLVYSSNSTLNGWCVETIDQAYFGVDLIVPTLYSVPAVP